MIKNKIQSLKFSKKSVRVNFNYPLKINDLSLQKEGLGRVGVGGGIEGYNFNHDSQNFLSPNQSDLVRKENLAPDLKSLQTAPLILPNSIHQSKMRNLKK